MMERLTAAEAVTADGRRWLVVHSVHLPTSTLIEEVFSADDGGWQLIAAYASADREESMRFWGSRTVVTHDQLPEIPPGLPDVQLVDSIKPRTTPHTRTWFAAGGGS